MRVKMLYQSSDPIRGLVIFLPQLFMALMFLYLAYKLLKRNKHRPTITFSLFYLVVAFGLIFNAILLLVRTFNPENIILIYILYFLTSYPLIFSFIFLLTFIISILKLETTFTVKTQILIVLIYGIINVFVYLFPGGIFLEESLGWRPVYSWIFSIFLYIFFTFSIVIPTLIYSSRLMRMFVAKDLKRRLRLFIFGIYGMYITFYGAILYNTWQEPFYQTLWSILAFILMVTSAFFIYYGIGQNL